MAHRLVPVPMRVWFRHRTIVFVLMMLVVDMSMFVFQHVMDMRMLVAFRQMQPQAYRHKCPRDHELDRQAVSEYRQGHEGADEGSQREVCSGSRRAKMS